MAQAPTRVEEVVPKQLPLLAKTFLQARVTAQSSVTQRYRQLRYSLIWLIIFQRFA
ncbi:hypothetical protein [Prochlorococcus marinus]|uniref:hypothetical protein n=1 Tax=Prochlorococcus marinus TaxID=1219 RepID=UPI0022B46DF9|nr:hypothetical protein [Prochlorococcus marinus]